MEECFGKGAVRATRVQHAVSSSTCMDWCTVVFGSMMTALVAAAAVWVGELIARLGGLLERVLAFLALGGVPLAIVLWMIKVCIISTTSCIVSCVLPYAILNPPVAKGRF